MAHDGKSTPALISVAAGAFGVLEIADRLLIHYRWKTAEVRLSEEKLLTAERVVNYHCRAQLG
jgi:hypothetical protein